MPTVTEPDSTVVSLGPALRARSTTPRAVRDQRAERGRPRHAVNDGVDRLVGRIDQEDIVVAIALEERRADILLVVGPFEIEGGVEVLIGRAPGRIVLERLDDDLLARLEAARNGPDGLLCRLPILLLGNAVEQPAGKTACQHHDAEHRKHDAAAKGGDEMI